MRLALSAALALALAQLWLIGRVELTFDEAYYALWARFPQFGYYDHPPLVAWTIRASTTLFGRSEFGVRALFWLEGAAMPALVAWIGWRLFDARTAATAALLWVAAPLSVGAPLATPDTPLAFFWTLALLGLVEVYRGREAAWGLVGLAAGAAGLAKMTAGFLPLGVALALWVTPSLRVQWRRPGPWVAAGLAFAVVSPFLAWNATHGFATFVKQGGRVAARAFAPRYLLEFAGAQIALFNPVTATTSLLAGFLGPRAFRALVRAGPTRGPASGWPMSEPTRLLLATAAPAFGYFLLHALHDRVQGNWPAPIYPALLLAAARGIAEAPSLRWAPYAAAALAAVVVAAVYLHLATGLPALGPSDPADRIGGWRELAARVFDIAAERRATFVMAHGYAATSELSFYGPETPPVVQAEDPERWTFRPPIDLSGEGLAFGPPGFEEDLARRFSRVEPIETLRRRVGQTVLEPYTLFLVADPKAGRR